jgi:hypothetical protein
MSEQKSKVMLTGLWRKQGQKGEFLAGNLSGRASLLVFPNSYKQKDSDPDYMVYIAQNEPKDRAPKAEISNEDIPF